MHADQDPYFSRRLNALDAAGLRRRLRTAERARGRSARLRVDGRELLSFASNDYLGLSQHPEVLAAAGRALETHGAGATASRLICGGCPLHAELETELARFKRTEAALVFPSGYQAALATLGAVARPEPERATEPPVVLLDRLAHACLLDGARLSGARTRVFKHNEPHDLERLLKREITRTTRVCVVVESLYSMDGDVAPLAEIWRVARAFGALLLVDEAHATGVLGPDGRGCLAERFDGALPSGILSMGTLSKALGSQGGFVCGSRAALEVIAHDGRAFMFSTGLNPAAVGAAQAALALAHGEPARRTRLLARAEELRRRWRAKGLKVLGGPGPILPIQVGTEASALRVADACWAAGLWIPAIRFPTVKQGQARLRVSLSAEHTDEDLARLDETVQASICE